MARRVLGHTWRDADVELQWTADATRAFQERVPEILLRLGSIVRLQAIQAAPVGRTGQLRSAIHITQFRDGNVSVFVGTTKDPRTGKDRPANLPLWLEYGTRRAGARPFLVPAGAAIEPQLDAEITRLMTGLSG